MNRLEAVAGISLAALIGGGLVHTYRELSRLAQTPAPARGAPVTPQLETRPARSIDETVSTFLSNVESAAADERLARLSSLLAALETHEFEGESIEGPAAESLARYVVSTLSEGDGFAEDLELRRRAVRLLAGQVPGRVSRDFVIKTLAEGPEELRLAALERVGSPSGVRGALVYEKVRELGERGLVPDGLRPQVLRRTGGLKAKDELVTLLKSTDSGKLIAGCAVSLQDYRDPELLGPVLERLEQVGMLESGRLPWISPALLDEHLRSADRTRLRRGLAAMAARPSLLKAGFSHVERGLQSADAESRRHAAIAVKKAVVAKLIDPQLGETLLAGRLEQETEPVLKAELSGGLERVRSVLAQPQTGVQ